MIRCTLCTQFYIHLTALECFYNSVESH